MMKSRTQFLIIGLTTMALLTIDVALRTIQLRAGGNNAVVTAREFRLVDASGNRRATLATDASGEPGIFLFDQTGTLRAQLDTMESTPSLILYGPNSTARRVYFGMDEYSGDGILDMYGADGETSQASMTVNNSKGFVRLGNGGNITLTGTSVQMHR